MGCRRFEPGAFLAYFVQSLILLTILYSISIGDLSLAGLAVIAFLITIVPYVIRGKDGMRICLPWGVNLLIALSLFLHVAGYAGQYYETYFPYYDKLAHVISSTTIAILGFVLVLLVDRVNGLGLQRWMIAVLILSITLALGAFWEIFEFTADQLLGTHLQYGLTDTMLDLIFDLFGAILVAALGSLYLRRVTKEELISRLIIGPSHRSR
ncbi:MAG: hypothetical protein EHJ95_00890 [Methanobacteriota archaeon]|nr:MAG: hypothetical protein EHJ95_00890 [Euryarchaeota archaeon]